MRFSRLVAIPLLTLATAGYCLPASALDCLTMDQMLQPGMPVTFNNPIHFPNTAMEIWIGPFNPAPGQSTQDGAGVVPTNGCGGSYSGIALHAVADDLYGRLSDDGVSKVVLKVCDLSGTGNLGADISWVEFIGDIMTLNGQSLRGPFGTPVSASANAVFSSNSAEIILTGPSVSNFVVGGDRLSIAEICVE
jgi:hypothetical protein